MKMNMCYYLHINARRRRRTTTSEACTKCANKSNKKGKQNKTQHDDAAFFCHNTYNIESIKQHNFGHIL